MSTLGSWPALAEICKASPASIALVLGSGMGTVVDRWGRLQAVPFGDVPGLTASSVHGHRGQLSLVELGGRRVLVLEGRSHFYEGHPWERVTQPMRTVASLGAKVILHTNAAGGIHDALAPGSLMAIRNHMDCCRTFWWRDSSPRPSPYSPRLLDVLDEAARGISMPLPHGVYASLTGPSYETPAEIRALRSWGADAVGMSTAREVQSGVDLGMECAAVSCITNRAAGLSDTPLSHEEVLVVARGQTERLGTLLEGFVAGFSQSGEQAVN